MYPFPGLRVYPFLQLTVNTIPVDPPLAGIMFSAFVIECVPVQLFATNKGVVH